MDWRERERLLLSPYACFGEKSRGRVYIEDEHPFRSPYQRDRDRILHSAAFRRLKYKTQVFIPHEGDYYRTRLTHTLEVSQIARTIAQVLGLNEMLVESLALVHDIGHTPFGHTGEEVLNEMMKGFGGFEHNLHALRVVDVLEVRYVDRAGLNLSWEVREGIAKHSKWYDKMAELHNEFGASVPSLEAQVVEIADEIAYDSHDLDDAIASSLICLDDALEVSLLQIVAEGLQDQIKSDEEMFRHYLIRGLIDFLVSDVIKSLQKNICEYKIQTVEDVRKVGVRICGFSEDVALLVSGLRDFLHKRVYGHRKVRQQSLRCRQIVEKLFEVYVRYPELMPSHFCGKIEKWGVERVVTDYIAGMTDRYAINEYEKIFIPY